MNQEKGPLGIEDVLDSIVLHRGVNLIHFPQVVGSTKTLPYKGDWYHGEFDVTTPTLKEAQVGLENKITHLIKTVERQGGRLMGFVAQKILTENSETSVNFAVVFKDFQ